MLACQKQKQLYMCAKILACYVVETKQVLTIYMKKTLRVQLTYVNVKKRAMMAAVSFTLLASIVSLMTMSLRVVRAYKSVIWKSA